MARPWVKFHACILDDDEFVFEMPREHVGTWALMLVLAGRVDDGGRLGKRAVVAGRLGLSDAGMADTVAALHGRVVTIKGELWIRDWADWQSDKTSTDRSRESRAGVASSPPETPPDSPGNAAATLQQQTGNENESSSRARRASTSTSNSIEETEAVAPREPTAHQSRFGAVAEICGFDWHLIDDTAKHGITRLASELGKTDPPWTPDEIRHGGEEWYSVKFKSRARATVTAPTVAQAKTWLGSCRVRWQRAGPAVVPASRQAMDWTDPRYVDPWTTPYAD